MRSFFAVAVLASCPSLDGCALPGCHGPAQDHSRLRGTLLFVTASLASPSRKGDETDVWLWVRTPGGDYIQVARTSHYERMKGDDLVYWIPETRRFKAFNVVTHASRDLPGYRVPPFVEDDVEGVSIETGGKRLMFGQKGSAGWKYEPLPLEPGRFE